MQQPHAPSRIDFEKGAKEISNQTFEFQKAEMYSKTVFSKLLLNNYNKGAVFLLDLLQ